MVLFAIQKNAKRLKKFKGEMACEKRGPVLARIVFGAST